MNKKKFHGTLYRPEFNTVFTAFVDWCRTAYIHSSCWIASQSPVIPSRFLTYATFTTRNRLQKRHFFSLSRSRRNATVKLREVYIYVVYVVNSYSILSIVSFIHSVHNQRFHCAIKSERSTERPASHGNNKLIVLNWFRPASAVYKWSE